MRNSGSVRALALLTATVALGATVATTGAAGAGEHALEPAASIDHIPAAYNVLVPGQSGAVPFDTHSTDQIPLYDGLTPLFGRVRADDIPRYFKPATLGDTSGTVEARPRRGLRIVRDEYGVPKIIGDSRYNVEFGAGWVAAHDRGLLMEALRGPARIAAIDAPGLDAFRLANQLARFEPSAATEQRLLSQITVMQEREGGEQIVADVDAYLDGINAYYDATDNPAERWTRADVVALTSLIGAVFGRGGGAEVRNSDVLAHLQTRFGRRAGRALFNDLRAANDPEAPTTITRRFPYADPGEGPHRGSLVIDPGSVEATSALGEARSMSNALLVSGDRSGSGAPLAVMGPQVGYYYPEILLEMELNGGGLNARGAAFPGTSLYVQMGRGTDFAWSATSAGSDNIDQFLEQLCNPDGTAPTRASTHYVFNGTCTPMTTFRAGVLRGTPDREVVFHETVHGPVSGTATVRGKPYAITTKRSTSGRDVASAFGFVRFNERVRGPRDFFRAASLVEFTFNWFYAGPEHTAYYSSGRLPLRAPGVDPGLPTLGTGAHEWQGFLAPADHPHAIDPPSGLMVNWNNKPAPGFAASDSNWSYGPVYRSELFRGIPRNGARIEHVVGSMNRAASQDERAALVWPVVARVLATGAAPGPDAAHAVELVDEWVGAHQANLLDRDSDGFIDHPGAVIFSRAWGRITDAVMSARFGTTRALLPREGDAGYVDKDLRHLLGEPVKGAFSQPFCGLGDLAACRSALWAAMAATATELAAQQGTDPHQWRTPARRQGFAPGLLPNTIRATNRPTFQQVIAFGDD